MVNVYSTFSQFCTLSGVMNSFEFFPMQAESPGHLEVLLGGAGTLGCPRGLLNERVSCPKREDPGLFWGCREPGSGLCRPPTWGKDMGSGRSNQSGTDLHVPLTKPWDSEGTQADLPLGQQRQVHGKCDPSQKGNERKGGKEASICT